MSKELNLGQIITTEQQKDAIHIAVTPVEASEILEPGKPVGILPNGKASHGVDAIGVVDPFLNTYVNKGEKFWLYLKPGSITSLRHDWTHPAFQVETKQELNTVEKSPCASSSEAWLRAFASEWNMDYESMIRSASSGYGITARDMDIHSWDELEDGQADLFWHHLEIATGKKFGPERRANTYFSCSC